MVESAGDGHRGAGKAAQSRLQKRAKNTLALQAANRWAVSGTP